ncbi:thioesterase II family protein [Gorillibacterium timonense]|uniref:thioesterase II family protein n=1 Tax=Gorillibacterium timonense TaxID=1689269 RepID=UPI00131CD16E|nr:thioesterase domain-containing protein [Gorillibacterium timonense]
MKKIILYCLPYAGGSSYIYQQWRGILDDFIEVIPLEYSGRGTRFGDSLIKSAEEHVDDLFCIVKSRLEEPFAFFGHSMGSLLTFELIRTIHQRTGRSPVHGFFSAGYPPNRKPPFPYSSLPDDDFVSKIQLLGGTPIELFQQKDLLKLFLPILRADFQVIDEYVYQPELGVLPCDITIFSGEHDPFTRHICISEWEDFTNGSCSFMEFPEGHFFIRSYEKEIVDTIRRTLESYKAHS